MRTRDPRFLASSVLALALSLPAGAWGNISGSWEGNITNERGEHIITVAKLRQSGESVTGDVSLYGATALPICKGAFDGQVLRFEMGREGQTCDNLDPDSTIRFEGRLKGPSLSGTADDGKIKGSFFWIQVEETAVIADPAPQPTAVPTEAPAAEPTAVPTEAPAPEPTAVPSEVPTAEPVALPTEVPAPPTPEPTANPVAQPTAAVAAKTGGGGASPYEITRAYIAAVRGEDAAAFVAVWISRDRDKNKELLQLIFTKKKAQLRTIADSLETKLSSDAFQLQDKGALLEYPCTGNASGKNCVFTVTQEADGLWYVEDLD